MPTLHIKKLHTFHIGPLDFAIHPSQCLVISGHSGSGKSLTLRAIADLDPEDGSFHDNPTGVAHLGFARDAFGRILRQQGFGPVHFFDAHNIRKQTTRGEIKDFSVFLAIAKKGQP